MKELIQALTVLRINMEQTAEHIGLIKSEGVQEWLKPNLASISETLIASGGLVSTLIELARKTDEELTMLDNETTLFCKYATKKGITQDYCKWKKENGGK